MMSSSWPLSWENALDHYRSQHFQVVTREQLLHTPLEILLGGVPTSSATLSFLESLSQPRFTLWEAFVRGAQTVYEIQENEIFAPLKYLLERARHLAVLYGEHFSWKSSDKWSYLFEVNAANGKNARQYILAHPPATQEQIQQAETVLGMQLPPQYVQLLKATNGLGFELDELSFVCGAGSERAAWDDGRTFQPGAFMRPSYHEIASYWFQWQDVYAYEREQDSEAGESTFLSNERICVPFAYTTDDWCFDRSRHDDNGEYPILLWDHELRQAEPMYSDFAAWFVERIIHQK